MLPLPFSLQLALGEGGEAMPRSAAVGHPSSPLTGQSMCLINQRHAIGKRAPRQRSADTLIHLTPSHNSLSALPDPGQPRAHSTVVMAVREKENLKERKQMMCAA